MTMRFDEARDNVVETERMLAEADQRAAVAAAARLAASTRARSASKRRCRSRPSMKALPLPSFHFGKNTSAIVQWSFGGNAAARTPTDGG